MTRSALFTKHQKLAEQMAGSWHIAGADRDDVLQELRIALWEATGSWNLGRGAPFPDFAQEVMRRRMADALTKANRLKHQVLTYAKRQGPRMDDDEGNYSFEIFDYVATRALSSEELVIQLDELRGVIGAILGLTPVQRKAIVRAINGDGPESKQDDNALYSARRRLKQLRETESLSIRPTGVDLLTECSSGSAALTR